MIIEKIQIMNSYSNNVQLLELNIEQSFYEQSCIQDELDEHMAKWRSETRYQAVRRERESHPRAWPGFSVLSLSM